MRRDPSIHIRRSDLVSILNKIQYTQRTTGIKLADMIFDEAEKYQIRDRYLDIMSQKAKTRKKVQKSMEADRGVPDKLVEKFNSILSTYRQLKNPHGKIRNILKSSKEYVLLKEVAKLAHKFSEHFDISPREDGYREYIEIGYGMMRKYSLNRFKYYDSKIYEIFEDKVTVLTDDDREGTLQFLEIWKDAMLEYSGLDELLDIEDDYGKMSFMVLGRKAADDAGADYTEWIFAQFEGLAFLNSIPEFSQFSGDNAQSRYERYLRNSVEVKDDDNNNSITDFYE